MKLENVQIGELNHQSIKQHQRKFEFVAADIAKLDDVMEKLMAFNIAIPSWALGTGGTRFGRFSGGGEPRSLEEKIGDVGLIHALNKSSNSISLHIPWDIPENATNIKLLASQHGLHFDAVNSNTFQDQRDQALTYKFGSLHHVDKAVRQQAVDHNIQVIKYGVELGSKALSVWLADGSNFPGQLNFRHAFQNTLESLQEIYAALPHNWKIWLEYKRLLIGDNPCC
jgi:L-rhamnose isomerase/sugar isomerase